MSTRPRKPRNSKYFNLQEGDNAWWVYKKRKGFYLCGNEVGEVNGPSATISDALDWGGNQYGGEYAEIDTNAPLEEVFEIMMTHNFEPLLHNLSRIYLNGIAIDAQSFKNFVIWYAEWRKASAAKKD